MGTKMKQFMVIQNTLQQVDYLMNLSASHSEKFLALTFFNGVAGKKITNQNTLVDATRGGMQYLIFFSQEECLTYTPTKVIDSLKMQELRQKGRTLFNLVTNELTGVKIHEAFKNDILLGIKSDKAISGALFYDPSYDSLNYYVIVTKTDGAKQVVPYQTNVFQTEWDKRGKEGGKGYSYYSNFKKSESMSQWNCNKQLCEQIVLDYETSWGCSRNVVEPVVKAELAFLKNLMQSMGLGEETDY